VLAGSADLVAIKLAKQSASEVSVERHTTEDEYHSEGWISDDADQERLQEWLMMRTKDGQSVNSKARIYSGKRLGKEIGLSFSADVCRA